MKIERERVGHFVPIVITIEGEKEAEQLARALVKAIVVAKCDEESCPNPTARDLLETLREMGY